MNSDIMHSKQSSTKLSPLNNLLLHIKNIRVINQFTRRSVHFFDTSSARFIRIDTSSVRSTYSLSRVLHSALGFSALMHIFENVTLMDISIYSCTIPFERTISRQKIHAFLLKYTYTQHIHEEMIPTHPHIDDL